MRLCRALFLLASPLVACESLIGLEAVNYRDLTDGSAEPPFEGGHVDGASGDVTDNPTLDGSVSDGPTEGRDADAGPPPGRPDSSAGSAGVSCGSSTCASTRRCCVDTDYTLTCRSTACETKEAYFSCDDPHDCAAGNKGCCGSMFSGLLAGSSCATSCAGLWFCVTTADCPSGQTCKPAPAAAPPGANVCQ